MRRTARGRVGAAGGCGAAGGDGHSDDSSSASDSVKARLGDIYHQEEGMVVADIPMERGQSLRIELTLVCGEGMRYQIHSWYVYDSGQYEIDNSMPVWDGSSGA